MLCHWLYHKKKKELKEKQKINKWVEGWDPSSGHYYYYNTETHESVWDKPEEFVPGLEDEEMNAVLRIQCAFRAKVARRKVEQKKTKEGIGNVLSKNFGGNDITITGK